MKVSHLLYSLLIVSLVAFTVTGNFGCAQIGSVTGGNKDTLAPVLLKASPQLLATNFTGNKITFTFDEYIDELQDVQSNVLVSPYPKRNPEVSSK